MPRIYKYFILLVLFGCGNSELVTSDKPKGVSQTEESNKSKVKVEEGTQKSEDLKSDNFSDFQQNIETYEEKETEVIQAGGDQQKEQAPQDQINTPSTNNTDQFDLAQVQWLGTNISSWEVRANLPTVEFKNGQICLGYDKANQWQVRNSGGTEVVANPWVFIEKNGVWYAATWEWMRPGQVCKAMTSVAGDHIKKFDVFAENWKPQSGQKLGFMVSTLIRLTDEKNDNGQSSRTNVVFTTWP